jgi:rhodanese-related sulfurtransferase
MQNVEYEEALKMAKQNGKKLVWLGSEPEDYIRSLLDIEEGLIEAADPMEMLNAPKEELLKYEGSVLVCYHGNTSAFVSEMIRDKHGIETFNLRGGITSIVGEIF